MGDLLELNSVSKVFSNGTVALDDVSIEAAESEILVLLGPSGSGKTTLLRSIAGIEEISSGEILIGGRLMAGRRTHRPPEERSLAMVFQDYALWPHYTVCENVAFALKREKCSRGDRTKRASQMLERVGLGHLTARYPSELSGGEQQRVALARALVGRRGIILFDEPLSNLDSDLRERMRIEISELVRHFGATAVYITHDQAEAFALADRVGVLERGRLVQAGCPEDVYAEPATAFVARFTGLSAELPVRIARSAGPGGLVQVEVDDGRRPVLARALSPLRPGEGVLLVRPSGVQLCEVGSPRAHLSGTVSDVAFRGRGYEFAVALDGGLKVTGIVARYRADRGRVVGLELSPSGCHVFREDSSGVGVPAPDPEGSGARRLHPIESQLEEPVDVFCW